MQRSGTRKNVGSLIAVWTQFNADWFIPSNRYPSSRQACREQLKEVADITAIESLLAVVSSKIDPTLARLAVGRCAQGRIVLIRFPMAQLTDGESSIRPGHVALPPLRMTGVGAIRAHF